MRQSFIVIAGSLFAGFVGGVVAITLSGTTAGASKILATDLGPADSLILAAPDGMLSITNKEGRIAWAAAPSARAYSVGCLHIDRVMKGLLASERFTSERKKFENEARSQGEEFESRSKALQSKYSEIKPDDPSFEDAKREFTALQAEYEKWFATLQKIQSKHMAEQVQQAYREMTAALDVVADRQRIDFVYRFVPPDQPFDAVELSDAMMQVQGRPFLRVPASTEITEDVLKELGLTSDP